MIDVDSDIVAGDWPGNMDWAKACDAAVEAAITGAGYGQLLTSPDLHVEISVRLTDDAEVQRLNHDYRGKDKPTNILSFPMHEADTIAQVLRAGQGDLLLGDMAVAVETLCREAEEKQITLHAHFTHLLIHGTLHLLGHDHAEDAEAEAMEALETAILARLGIADPYNRERS